jgi:signal transduction histidine kinase
MKFNSLALRLFITAAAWMIVILPPAGLIIFSLIQSHIIDGFESQLKTYVWVVQAESMGEGSVPERPMNIGEPLFGVTNSGWYWQIRPLDPSTGPAMVSESLATAGLPSPFENKAKPDEDGFYWLDVKGPLDQPLRVVERTGRLAALEEEGPLYSFVVAGPLDWPQSRISSFGLMVAVSLAIAGLALLAATFLQIRFGLAPLTKVEQGLAQIRSGAAEKLEGALPSEIEPLQVELNALIESNQEIIERARTQVGNLAHALKTPLAVITNEAEERDTAFARKVAEQAELMRGQVSHYLDRARMVARKGTIGRVSEVLPVAEGLQRTIERIYRDKGVTIILDCPENLKFHGEQQDLEEMLGNLLDNAAKWCRKRVRLTISTAPDPKLTHVSRLKVQVEDDGPGLIEEKRKLIWQRGVRLDETMPGSGLGLSIVADLVRTYRGGWELGVAKLGGLSVTLFLPTL